MNMSSQSPGEGRIVIVTGARRGIGRGVAEHLLKRGYRVAGVARSTDCWSAPGFSYRPMDVCDERQVRTTFSGIRKEEGEVYGLVHCAGQGPITNHSMLMPSTTMNRFLEQNVVGTFIVNREVAKLLRRSGVGRIVNTSSVAVPLALKGDGAYVASKRAVERMSQVMARELAPLGITVNLVGPGPIPTDGLARVPEEQLQETVAALPIPGFGRVEDVANVVDFFLDPKSDAISGQVVYLSGVANV